MNSAYNDSFKVNYRPSLNVFLNFVKYDNTGKADVRGIFSESCLKEWLNSRTKIVLHPLQSFQRVLYAHIRNIDRRRPFPSEIESELLRLLRLRGQENPWNLLENHKPKRAKKLFKHLGYHEKLNKGKEMNLKKENLNQQICVAKVLIDVAIKPHDLFLQVFDTLPKILRDSIVGHAAIRGIDIFSSPTRYLTNLVPNPSDYRYREDFLVPEQTKYDREGFDLTIPIGVFKLNPSWIVISQDEICTSLLGRDLVGLSYFELGTSIATVLRRLIFSFEAMKGKGRAWKHAFMLDSFGRIQVIFMKFISNSDFTLDVQLQVVTSKFPEILKLVNRTPFF